MLAIFQAAGWPIWLLLIASIVATALIIERLLYLRRARILPRGLLDEVVKIYRGGNITPDIIALLERGLTMMDQKAAVIQLIEGAVLLAAVVLARQERKQ